MTKTVTTPDIYFPVSKINTLDMIENIQNVNSNVSHAIVVGEENNKRIVSFCSKEYELIPNSEIFPLIDSILEKKYKYAKKITMRNSSEFYVDYRIIDKKTIIGNSRFENVNPILRVVHSYNGRLKFGLKIGLWRQVCSNGLFGYVYDSKLSMLHTEGLATVIKNDFTDLVLEGLKNIDKIKTKYTVLTDISVKREDVSNIVDLVIANTNFPKRQKDSVLNRISLEVNEGLSLSNYIIYNGFNYVLNHNNEFDSNPDTRMNIDKSVFRQLESQLI